MAVSKKAATRTSSKSGLLRLLAPIGLMARIHAGALIPATAGAMYNAVDHSENAHKHAMVGAKWSALRNTASVMIGRQSETVASAKFVTRSILLSCMINRCK